MTRSLSPGRCAAVAVSLVLAAAVPAAAQDGEPVRVGDLNSYTALPAFTEPYRNGWRMALERINEAGGVLDGRPLEVISRDDGGNPGDATTVANELVRRQQVDLLFGTLLSNVGLAVSELAHRRDVPFIAAEPLTDAIAWEKGNSHTFRLRPGTYVQAAMLAEAASELEATDWATVAPNYEYGQSAVAAFKSQLQSRRDDVRFVAEQWPQLFEIDAGATAAALAREDPEAIYNVTFASDLADFVRQGKARGLFEDREVVSILGGEPEWVDPVGADAPEGWIVTGYPWYAIEAPDHKAFIADYRQRFEDYPRMGSLVGYITMNAVAEAFDAAGSTDTPAVLEALRGLALDTPMGEIRFRASDQQSTMGTWVGRLTVRDGMPRMVDWSYKHGADYLPGPEEAAARRGGN